MENTKPIKKAIKLIPSTNAGTMIILFQMMIMMPQAPEFLRKRWGLFETAAERYLKSRGFILTRQWEWIAPDRKLTEKELSAINFLILEWDYGGVLNDNHSV